MDTKAVTRESLWEGLPEKRTGKLQQPAYGLFLSKRNKMQDMPLNSKQESPCNTYRSIANVISPILLKLQHTTRSQNFGFQPGQKASTGPWIPEGRSTGVRSRPRHTPRFSVWGTCPGWLSHSSTGHSSPRPGSCPGSAGSLLWSSRWVCHPDSSSGLRWRSWSRTPRHPSCRPCWTCRGRTQSTDRNAQTPGNKIEWRRQLKSVFYLVGKNGVEQQLTSFTGWLASETERVRSSFHSGFTSFLITRVFILCKLVFGLSDQKGQKCIHYSSRSLSCWKNQIQSSNRIDNSQITRQVFSWFGFLLTRCSVNYLLRLF